MAPAHANDARIVVYVRERCHLCDQALDVVRAVAGETAADWTAVDIDTDPALVEQFTEQIPVTFVDGRQHDFWRVDPDRLRNALLGR